MNEPQRAALMALRSNRTNTIYSDLTLRCQGVEFSLHRAIVCPQSGSLRKTDALSPTRPIDEYIFPAATVRRVVLFLYEQCYWWQEDQPSDLPQPAEVFRLLLMQIDVHTAALHFEIDALRTCCEQDFIGTLPMIQSSGGSYTLLVDLAELIHKIPIRGAIPLWQAVVFAFVRSFGQTFWYTGNEQYWHENMQRVAFMRDVNTAIQSM